MGRCHWLIEVGRDEDGEMIVRECGAPCVTIEFEGVYGTGFRCEAGHHMEPLEIELAPFGPEWEREREERKRERE